MDRSLLPPRSSDLVFRLLAVQAWQRSLFCVVKMFCLRSRVSHPIGVASPLLRPRFFLLLHCVRFPREFLRFYAENVLVVAGFLQARICEWHHNSENNNAVTRYYVAGFVTSNLTPHVMGFEFASEEGVIPCQCWPLALWQRSSPTQKQKVDAKTKFHSCNFVPLFFLCCICSAGIEESGF
ncbi:hypothetical protein OAE40_01210 [Rubripirellula sp.]|nr:hypothetical protein [Rubripirellula sp.]MDB4654374.1 hypothetical protein [Rubripirellula sp.]